MKKRQTIFQAPTSMSRAIAQLRETLGLTQFEMASALGARERYVQWWESGKVVPGGRWVIRMLQLCPDAESLARFGMIPAPAKSESNREVAASKWGSDNAQETTPDGPSPLTKKQREELRHQMHDQIDILCDRAPNPVLTSVSRVLFERAGRYGRPKK